MDRNTRDDLIRAQGHGDKLDRLTAMLSGYREQMYEVIALAAVPPGRIAAISLSRLDRRARSILRSIDRTLDNPMISASAYGSLGDWGGNGIGPRIRDILRSAQSHARKEAA